MQNTHKVISSIVQEMLRHLNNAQLVTLKNTLERVLQGYSIVEYEQTDDGKIDNEQLLELFLSAKQIEGCSERTLKYYGTTMKSVLKAIGKSAQTIETEDLRKYLMEYHQNSKAGMITLANIRRILSSFFGWLENEDYIVKSPVRRIAKIKAAKIVKEAYTDDVLETLRDGCDNLRDLAIINLLVSSGMRVGELVKLNRNDINFEEREIIVFGKGNKERIVYFDVRAKVHLQNYLNSRKDFNDALFVTLDRPYDRLKISGVEIRLRELGRKLGLNKVHPHKFRRTMATRAIDKGMPIEQVQRLLGHNQVDTTLQYAMVKQSNVKLAHQKYLG